MESRQHDEDGLHEQCDMAFERPRRQRAKRERTLVSGRMRRPAGRDEEIVIRNISMFGLGASARTIAPGVGETLRIATGTSGTLRGTVQWSCGRAFGVRLDTPLEMHRIKSETRMRNTDLGQKVDMAVDLRLNPQKDIGSRFRPL